MWNFPSIYYVLITVWDRGLPSPPTFLKVLHMWNIHVRYLRNGQIGIIVFSLPSPHIPLLSISLSPLSSFPVPSSLYLFPFFLWFRRIFVRGWKFHVGTPMNIVEKYKHLSSFSEHEIMRCPREGDNMSECFRITLGRLKGTPFWLW